MLLKNRQLPYTLQNFKMGIMQIQETDRKRSVMRVQISVVLSKEEEEKRS